jgi:quinol monooxygenase YgiN
VAGLLSSLGSAMVGRHKDREESECRTTYTLVRYTVPPSSADDFEEAWLDLEKDTMDKDDPAIYNLQKTRTDNLFYWGYAEFDCMRDLRDHLRSKHFEDFAEEVDNLAVRWDLQILENLSEDIEEEQRDSRRQGQQGQQGGDQGGDWDKNIPEEYRKYIPDQYRPKHKHNRRQVSELSKSALATLSNPNDPQAVRELKRELSKGKGRRGSKQMISIIVSYFVPPEAREDFVDEWTDAAEKTIEEDGNMVLSLRKVKTDNTRYYAYGSWETVEDLRDHLESKHMRKLFEFYQDADIVYFSSPLVNIGGDRE